MRQNTTSQDAGWNFDNSYARLPGSLYTRLNPTPVREPQLILVNDALAVSLGLNVEAMRSAEASAVFAGNEIPEGAEPLAQAYAGHQFGHFRLLGDGRALLLGEQITPEGERVDIQLKGAGQTPYSRTYDGRAALGPMLREYIISEAMHGLGIPTTRSLAVAATGESIRRETELPGAVLTRIAASHLRVATFQYVSHFGTRDELRTLADYTLRRHFPGSEKAENRYLFLVQEVMKRQAVLIAKWQLVGFVHGVMNTDNMTISGETIDYGPCAFLDVYDPDIVFSTRDTEGRYAFGKQPEMAAWNLTRFAETLIPLLDESEERAVQLIEEEISNFFKLYHHTWLSEMREKLGIYHEEPEDESLIEELLRIMQIYRADYTNTFRALTWDKYEDTALSGTPEFTQWLALWEARLSRQPESKASSHQLMRRRNPAVIPRNHRVEEALQAAVNQGDYSSIERLLAALAAPFAHAPEQTDFAALPVPSSEPYRTYCGT
ncbi:protein adenylyltransferase SelO [Paenibacillus whitsoniae]|uniref:Protein nucleotidyltransferase YdiU n=1 Tax=Paenibacillus whitsoniae TaxID=2496558 RepID=A0A430JGH0_9BACL|nr:YdiU family protein [Paenibacillus whitsoniae]RTE10137.1 YdiU family protein [Paenibacillus whitsoniae]